MNRVLKIGEKFNAESVHDRELKLHSVIVDNNKEYWAIGLDESGTPVVVNENDIDPEPLEILIAPKEKGKKK